MINCKGIFLIACFITPFAGSWQFLALHLYWVRKDVHEKISNGSLGEEEDQVLFKFTDEEAAELSWEHSREFEYKGEMYDIIRQERKNDTTWYWCYWDKKETKVRKDMRNVLARSLTLPQQQKNQERIGDFFKTLFLHQGPQFRAQDAGANGLTHAERDALQVLSNAPSPPNPPPEFSV